MSKTFMANLAVLTLVGTMNAGLSGKPRPDAPDTQRQALNAVRLINTAQAFLSGAGRKFVPFPDLVASGSLTKVAGLNEDLNETYRQLDIPNPGELIKGFIFDMVVAPDGRSYKLSLIEKSRCGMALFSDNGGLIYNGRVIGCASK